jgi:hypothetical protein
MSSLRFPNVDDEFTVELNGTPSWTDPQGGRWASLRKARLWNYPNEGDELLRDHRAWLDENVVAALRQGRTLTCRLLGSASNDNAGVAHNLQVADRRARKARAFLLGKGVDERQIVEVEAYMDTRVHSTSARDRHVDVVLRQPVDTIFDIRKVVLESWSSLLPWGAVHFFEIRARLHRLTAFYVLANNRPFNTGPAPFFAVTDRPGFPPECDRARWALEIAVRLVRERAGWPYVLREQVLDGLRRALRQVQQREALLETLVELRLELMSLKGEHQP